MIGLLIVVALIVWFLATCMWSVRDRQKCPYCESRETTYGGESLEMFCQDCRRVF